MVTLWLLFVLISSSISSNLLFSRCSICVNLWLFCSDNLRVIISISLLICDGSVNSLPKFLSNMLLPFSETLVKVALPCRRLVTDLFSSLGIEIQFSSCVYFFYFPLLKTTFGWGILRISKILLKNENSELFLQRKKLQGLRVMKNVSLVWRTVFWVLFRLNECGEKDLGSLLEWFYWLVF